MNAAGFLKTLVGLLDTSRIPYMLTGSFASTFHGVPRATQDIDLVVELTDESLGALLSALPEDRFYVSEGAAREALLSRRQFNIIDMETGWKADLIVRKDRPFSVCEFQRREMATLLEMEIWITTAEDTILAKLEWAMRSGSERQLADAGGVVQVRGKDLDTAYIERWARKLGVQDLWERVSR